LQGTNPQTSEKLNKRTDLPRDDPETGVKPIVILTAETTEKTIVGSDWEGVLQRDTAPQTNGFFNG
jgi:hypothetical protein